MKKIITFITLCLTTTIFTFAQTTSLKVTDAGNVGIGTDNPTAKLEVAGTIKLNNPGNLNYITGSNDLQRIALLSNTTPLNSRCYFYMFNNDNPPRAGEFSMAGKYIRFVSNSTNTSFGTESMRLTANGRLGIGTNAPAYTLHVNGTAAKPGGGSWIAASDRQLKNNINAYEDGLETLMKVNPVTFQYNGKAGIKTGKTEFVGVIAQELQKVAPYMIQPYQYTQVNKETNEVEKTEEYLSVDPSALTYMLINAVQEQQEVIEKLQERITQLERGTDKETYKTESDISIKGAGRLSQNTPNPFSENTTIQYELTDKNAQAEIQIFSLTGKLLKVVPADGRTGQVTVQVTDMPAGTYTYSLVVNGKIIDTKKMVLSK